LASRLTRSHPIGKRLKQARLAAGYSQARLGVLAGIDPSVASARINQYERQRHQPAFEVVRRLAHVLKKPAPYFYATDDALAELIALYGHLGASDRAALLTMARKRESKSR
jgi:transcriptional regulator with XRE-family HTH domain